LELAHFAFKNTASRIDPLREVRARCNDKNPRGAILADDVQIAD
jgi:hypothetical protein